MTPMEMSARFAAFVWYTNCRKAPRARVQEEARQFAGANWQAFVSVANPGIGRLLFRIARPRRKSRVPAHTARRHAALSA